MHIEKITKNTLFPGAYDHATFLVTANRQEFNTYVNDWGQPGVDQELSDYLGVRGWLKANLSPGHYRLRDEGDFDTNQFEVGFLDKRYLLTFKLKFGGN